MYIPRWIVHQLEHSSHILPVTVLTGARQTGKSTLLANEPLFADYAYTTLDDYETRGLAQRNPKAFLDTAATWSLMKLSASPTCSWPSKRLCAKRRRDALSSAARRISCSCVRFRTHSQVVPVTVSCASLCTTNGCRVPSPSGCWMHLKENSHRCLLAHLSLKTCRRPCLRGSSPGSGMPRLTWPPRSGGAT
jgi:hypothetical protein